MYYPVPKEAPMSGNVVRLRIDAGRNERPIPAIIQSVVHHSGEGLAIVADFPDTVRSHDIAGIQARVVGADGSPLPLRLTGTFAWVPYKTSVRIGLYAACSQEAMVAALSALDAITFFSFTSVGFDNASDERDCTDTAPATTSLSEKLWDDVARRLAGIGHLQFVDASSGRHGLFVLSLTRGGIPEAALKDDCSLAVVNDGRRSVARIRSIKQTWEAEGYYHMLLGTEAFESPIATEPQPGSLATFHFGGRAHMRPLNQALHSVK